MTARCLARGGAVQYFRRYPASSVVWHSPLSTAFSNHITSGEREWSSVQIRCGVNVPSSRSGRILLLSGPVPASSSRPKASPSEANFAYSAACTCSLRLLFLKRGAFRKVGHPPLRRHTRCALCPSAGQPSHTGKCCEAEASCRRSPFPSATHLLTSDSASRAATAVDR